MNTDLTHRRLSRLSMIFLSILLLDCPKSPSPKLLGIIGLVTSSTTYGITLTETNSETSVTEGTGSDNYTIVLTSAPTSDVTVTVSFDTTQLKINNSTTSPVQLTFTSTNWSIAQTVTVEALYDNLTEGTHTKSITHSVTSVDSGYNGFTLASVTVNITDAIKSITLVESGSSTNVTEGTGSDNYTIVLTSAPTSDVTVTVSFDTTQLKINNSTTSPVQLTFTSTNWSVAQTVTVEALYDNLTEGTHTKSITHSVTSADSGYNGFTLASVTVNITDTIKSITLAESGSSTIVTEGTGSDNYTIVLTSAPTSDVTVTVSFDTTQIKINSSTTSPVQLTFTSTNWSTAQTVTIEALNDNLTEGSHTKYITHSVTSADSGYNGFTLASVIANITDAGMITIAESGGSTNVIEGSGSDTYTVVLGTAPTSDVTVAISFDSAQLKVNSSAISPVQLTFTSTNWSVAQTVTVEALYDNLTEGTHTKSITHTVTSTDSGYNGFALANVTVNITDTIKSITLVESGSSTNVTEGTGSDNYTIVLTSAPTSDVTVTVSFDTTQLKINNSTTSPVQLTFTSTNWSIAQTVTVEALYDNLTEGTHTKSITHSVTSADSGYNGLTLANVTVNITDTTGATVNGSFQSGNLTLAAASQTVNLTTTVNATRAFVLCNAKLTSSNTNCAITCQLNTLGTQVTIASGGGVCSSVDWYVMEYSAAATVQRGTTTFTTSDSTLNATLPSSVSTNKTFVISYARSSVGGNTADANRTVMARLTSSTNLELSRNQTSGNAIVEWQVVQFDGSAVQSGTVSIANGNTSNSAALGSNVNLASSFLIFNYKAATATVGVESDFYVRGSYTNSSTLSFNRTGTNQAIDISWFAIQMIDGTTVQSGSATMASGAGTSVNSNLSSAVNTSKSMIVFSNDTTNGSAAAQTQDSGTYTATFNSSSQINFSRNNDETNSANINWFVVSFQ